MEPQGQGTATDLPSGLLTFVFTDIESSTRLYHALGDEVAGDVFDLHNVILRAAWTGHNGREVHTEGDSFFVVFEDPDDAVAACVSAQQELAAATWPGDVNVRVRMGLHCGLAVPRNDDYMALSVHQAARVMSAANGAQILATEALVDRLTRTTAATSVGEYRLRDFDEPPILFRIDSPSLPVVDLAPRATPSTKHNLVAPLTSFVGRQADLVTIDGLLTAGQAVTLVGLGGIGKTRLATEVGLRIADGWDGGAWIVELAEIGDGELIIEEIARALGAPASDTSDRLADIVDYVGETETLIILDNLEHLIEECAALVPQILRSCPSVTILCTSREPLNCQGETVYRVLPLATDEVDDPAALASVELFIDRARAISPTMMWDDEALTQVSEICRRLDGFPLAIEIAAAQVGVLRLRDINLGLENQFKMLRSRDRSLPERQRTMQGLLGWSHDLLTEPEQRAFRRLGIFGGSFSVEAAESALAGDGIDVDDVPALMWSLIDKSLVAADLSEASTRYRLFESVRQYARRLLTEHDEQLRCATGLAEWLLTKVGPAEVNDRTWLGNVAMELANTRAVVAIIAETDLETAQQLMCSVGRYRDAVQSYAAGVEELAWALALSSQPTPSRVALLCELADLHLRMADVPAASSVLDEASEVQAAVGPPSWNDVSVARSQGEVAMRVGDYGTAIGIAQATLAAEPSQRGAARMWSILGIAQCSSGENDAGLASLERCLNIYVDLGDAAAIALAHGNVAEAALRAGDHPKAAHHQSACLDDGLVIGQPLAIANSLIMAANLAARYKSWDTAVPLYQFAETLLTDAKHQLYDDEQQRIQEAISSAEEDLGTARLTSIRAGVAEMDVLEVAQLAKTVFADETARLASGQRPRLGE